MAAEQGCHTLDLNDIAAGSVTIPTTHTSVNGSAKAEYTHTFVGQQKQYSSPRIVNVSGGDLVVTLEKGDKVGHKLCWTSYDS